MKGLTAKNQWLSSGVALRQSFSVSGRQTNSVSESVAIVGLGRGAAILAILTQVESQKVFNAWKFLGSDHDCCGQLKTKIHQFDRNKFQTKSALITWLSLWIIYWSLSKTVVQC